MLSEDNTDLVGTAISGVDGSPMPLSPEYKQRLLAERQMDSDIQNLLHVHMQNFLIELRNRMPEVGPVGFVGFAFLPERVVNVTNMQDRAYARSLIKKLGKTWEQQDAATDPGTTPPANSSR
jgi:hypothetical protein